MPVTNTSSQQLPSETCLLLIDVCLGESRGQLKLKIPFFVMVEDFTAGC